MSSFPRTPIPRDEFDNRPSPKNQAWRFLNRAREYSVLALPHYYAEALPAILRSNTISLVPAKAQTLNDMQRFAIMRNPQNGESTQLGELLIGHHELSLFVQHPHDPAINARLNLAIPRQPLPEITSLSISKILNLLTRNPKSPQTIEVLHFVFHHPLVPNGPAIEAQETIIILPNRTIRDIHTQKALLPEQKSKPGSVMKWEKLIDQEYGQFTSALESPF